MQSWLELTLFLGALKSIFHFSVQNCDIWQHTWHRETVLTANQTQCEWRRVLKSLQCIEYSVANTFFIVNREQCEQLQCKRWNDDTEHSWQLESCKDRDMIQVLNLDSLFLDRKRKGFRLFSLFMGMLMRFVVQLRRYWLPFSLWRSSLAMRSLLKWPHMLLHTRAGMHQHRGTEQLVQGQLKKYACSFPLSFVLFCSYSRFKV